MSTVPRRSTALAFAAVLIAMGIALRQEPRSIGWHAPLVVTHHGGGFLWGGLVYALVVAARPPSWGWRTCLASALGIVVMVEGSRLLHGAALDAFRLTLPGQWLLGRVFAPWNIAIDGLGAVSVAFSMAHLPKGPR